MISLSSALRRPIPGLMPDLSPYFVEGQDCPLGSAYLGTVSPDRLASFLHHAHSLDEPAFCSFMHNLIMRTFPWLGCSVRAFPLTHDEVRMGSSRMAAALEEMGLLPRYRLYQVKYRPVVHMSLWRAITELDRVGRSRAEIADLLSGWGL